VLGVGWEGGCWRELVERAEETVRGRQVRCEVRGALCGGLRQRRREGSAGCGCLRHKQEQQMQSASSAAPGERTQKRETAPRRRVIRVIRVIRQLPVVVWEDGSSGQGVSRDRRS
jgi:hypothetical protein